MNENDALIKEYESLRSEILDHQSRREKLFLYTITALGVVLGFIIKSSGITFFIVSFLPYFLIYNFCRIVRTISIHIITLGTYIMHFIAPHYENAFKWEMFWDRKAKSSQLQDKTTQIEDYWHGGGYWYFFFLISSIFTCVGIIGILLFSNTHMIINCNFRILFAIFQVLICVLTIIFGVSKIHWGKLNQETRYKQNTQWQEYSNSIKKNI